ncbi:MAG: hypothetical protein BM555_00275 [Crocinitomix sp. MedPE-SWsnd]|nr:MAG: hypothetical protein BM555_00275 [Crocinitomix sp. MedPE-SWsnd]
MKNFFSIAIALLLLLSAQSAFSSYTEVIADGDWDQNDTWSNGVPGCFDTIVIPAGLQVDITATVDLEGCANDSVLLIVYGHLEFQNGKKLKLNCDSDVLIYTGGFVGVGSGGGSSTYIEMCGNEYWSADSGNLTGPSILCDGGCVVLPIELVYFTATLNSNENVDLQWKTASEVNNDYFTVERSIDGVNWLAILDKGAVGNSSVPIVYDDIDREPLFGEVYYRLKQTDFDLSYTYSPAVRVNNFDITKIELYPNPVEAGNSVLINFPDGYNDDITIDLRSADGKVVLSQEFEIKESHQAILNLPKDVSAGVYTVSCAYFTKKVIIK